MFSKTIRYSVFSLATVLLTLDIHAQENPKPGISDTPSQTSNVANATLVIKSSGMPMRVDYSISHDEEACKGFEPIGAVFENTGKEKFLPGIARLTEKSRRIGGATTELKKTVAASKPIQIRGYSRWIDQSIFISMTRSCGPLVTKFKPSNSGIYLIEFLWSGNDCTQQVFDITDPAEKKTVPVQTVSQCEKD